MNDDQRKQIADELAARLRRAVARVGERSARERPINFAPQLVDAIVAGRKTQTRRPVRPANDYAVGDCLWVKEKWAREADGYRLARLHPTLAARWYSPLYMPKSAARLWLAVEEVAIEPLQSISADDLSAEGFDDSVNPVNVFRTAWDSFYAEQGLGWDANPDVVVVKFQVMSNRK